MEAVAFPRETIHREKHLRVQPNHPTWRGAIGAARRRQACRRLLDIVQCGRAIPATTHMIIRKFRIGIP